MRHPDADEMATEAFAEARRIYGKRPEEESPEQGADEASEEDLEGLEEPEEKKDDE